MLVDATGERIAPVLDIGGDIRTVRIALEVDGKLAVVSAHPTWFEGTTARVYYQTSDCSGPGFIEAQDSAPLFAPSVVVGANGSPQVLFIADVTSLIQQITALGVRSLHIDVCEADARVISPAYSAMGAVDLNTIGQRPFRVIRSPQ
jgi:hypothetical protein